MKKIFLQSAAVVAIITPGAAFAQSTGSADFEDTIVVTGASLDKGIGGVVIPNSPKAKVVLDKEIIQRQRPGQSINEIINLVPGVSFTNNDPWGSSGGSFSIRGFNSDRISQTFDGLPLNDSGNYAIYSNQQVDSELIENVNINLGSTDVDSPTAAAVGGTVNINTLKPSDEYGVLASVSYGNIVADGSGDRPYFRMFGMLQTGDLTGHGTKAWISASRVHNVAAFSSFGRINKQQYNAKIWQDIGDNGDFISIAGHYNQNRNNFGGSPLRANAVTGDKSNRFYQTNYPCTVSSNSTPNSCGTDFERRYNPSNTGNIRVNSRFTLADRLTLTIDGGYQYVKANGGGTTSANETFYTSGGQNFTGNYGGSFYFGRDLNDDGVLGRVTLVQPSQTNTRRWMAIANLAYELDDNNRVRLSYSYDRARHRQTGAAGFVHTDGEPYDVFPINDPVLDAAGNTLQKRDRLSYATLNQVAGEYRGQFLDDALTVQLGARMPFFQRDLKQNCFTTSSGGFVDCVPADQIAAYTAAKPYSYNETTGRATGSALPQSRKLKYDKLLPTVGATFKLTSALSVAANYAKNISAPSTDALYNAFYFPADSSSAYRVAETSDSFDLSLRYQTSQIQAAVTGWYSKYKNRLVTSYDIDGNGTDTNLGPVKKYGVDASVSYRPIPQILMYAFGSYIKSEIEEDAVTSGCAAGSDIQLANLCYVSNGVAYLRTAGNRERGAPKYLFGGRLQGTLGAFDLGIQAKRTSTRYLNDINGVPMIVQYNGANKAIYPGARFPAYTVVDLDLRYSLASLGMEKGAIQLNVSNLFDKFYVGSFPGGLDTLASSSSAFVNFGSPRAISASLIIGF
ncbi:TonB-dependent receptor [Sphingobium aquiterrae]|uniref:TonB-dependent receptor n=1 Tax=Sphingobium aquiterrae TaxID=2038656 RepID=UPI0030165756